MTGIISIHYFQNCREMEIYNSYSLNMGNYRKEQITVLANKLCVFDKMKYAQEVLGKYRQNQFSEIQFGDRFKVCVNSKN